MQYFMFVIIECEITTSQNRYLANNVTRFMIGRPQAGQENITNVRKDGDFREGKCCF